MSEQELRRHFEHIRGLPSDRVEWHAEVVDRDGVTIYHHSTTGTPDEAIQRWRELLLRCRTDRQWYAARLRIIPASYA